MSECSVNFFCAFSHFEQNYTMKFTHSASRFFGNKEPTYQILFWFWQWIVKSRFRATSDYESTMCWVAMLCEQNLKYYCSSAFIPAFLSFVSAFLVLPWTYLFCVHFQSLKNWIWERNRRCAIVFLCDWNAFPLLILKSLPRFNFTDISSLL